MTYLQKLEGLSLMLLSKSSVLTRPAAVSHLLRMEFSRVAASRGPLAS